MLVEAGIALPLLLMLIVGVVEVGALVRKAAVLSETVRASTLAVGAKGTSLDADLAAVTAVVDGLGKWSDDVDLVVVYRVTSTSDGRPPTQCLGNGAIASGGRMGECNVYGATLLEKILDGTLTTADLGLGSCPGEIAKFWCAADRDPASTERIGVWVRIRHTWVAGFFPGDKTLTDFAAGRVVGTL